MIKRYEKKIDLSLVIPVFNEAESLVELTEWIDKSLKGTSLTYEIIIIDDGSRDNSWEIIQNLKTNRSHFKAFSFQRNYGKTAALQVGFRHSVGEVVITLDADLQDSPDEIVPLYQLVREKKFDLVSGWKKRRHDPLNKTIPSKLFNYAVSKISRLKLHDFNCGLKAYSGTLARNIHIYGDMHRFIPLIAKWSGYDRITEKIVQHYPRKYGVTKYGFFRMITGFLDLLSISFIFKFRKNPMHFFGTIGVVTFLLGLCTFIYVLFEKLYANILLNSHLTRPVTDTWYFFVALICLLLGVQLFLTGFLGELMVRQNKTKKNSISGYIIAEYIDNKESDNKEILDNKLWK